jgi:hypothetical protein
MHTRSVSFASKARAAVALAVFVSGAQPVFAQDNVTIDARQCQRLESPADRLECYERQVNAASAQEPAAAPASPAPQAAAPTAPDARSAAPPPAAAAAAATAAPAASAGATPSNPSPAATSGQAKQSSAAKSSGDSKPTNPQDIVGKVTALSKTVPNAWLITLDNGQVWRQTYPEVYPLKPGQRVTLRPSGWGVTFRLTGDGMHGYIQVEKVR